MIYCSACQRCSFWWPQKEEMLPRGCSAMTLALCLLVLSGALHAASGLSVSLDEPDSESTPITLGDSPRSIPLVLDHSYEISCDGNWFHNGSPLSDTAPAEGVSGAYVMTDGSKEELILQLFSEEQADQYVCEEMGQQFVLNFTSDNPVLIPSRLVVGLELDNHISSPTITVLGSGTPQPAVNNYTWYFNDELLYSDGIEIDPSNMYLAVDHQSVTFQRLIVANVAGVYRSVLNTSVGVKIVNIQLNVEVPPSPAISVQSPADYSTEKLANGEPVTILCLDTGAIPVPTFTWSIDGRDISAEDEDTSITPGNSGRSSSLTILAVNQSHNGAVVHCTATNTVEDTEKMRSDMLSLQVLAPPPPPTNLTALAETSCQVLLSWVPPTAPPTEDALLPEYFLIEAQVEGSSDWVQMGGSVFVNETSSRLVEITDSQATRNVSYVFRMRSGNGRGGDSPLASNLPDPVQLYYDDLPVVTRLEASPLSSTPGPGAISLGWTNPPSECYRFSSHSVACDSSDAETPPSMGSAAVEGSASATEVTSLAVDRAYTCQVLSTVSDAEGNNFPETSASQSVDSFTYPDYPAIPSRPKPINVKQSQTNITVHFSVTVDSTISHYQVLVVRVRSKEELPTDKPDDLYPAGFTFVSEEEVNDQKTEKPLQGPYIAAEVAAENFSPTFVIGNSVATGPEGQYKNGPLLSATKYSCFLRVFPKSSVLLNRARRQEAGERQYAVFSSSDFMEVQETGEVDTSESSKNTLRAAIPGIAVGAVVTVLLIVFISLLLIIACTWRGQRRKKITLQSSSSSYASRSSSKDSLNFPEVATPDLCRKSPGGMEMKPLEFKNIISEDDEDLIPSGAIPVGLFREHVDKFDENRQLLFQHEFDWIQVNSPTNPSEASNLPVNDDKNRYSNIIAYDHSRVTLTPVEGVEGSDYINANYIPGFKRTREYISTQGPLEQTVVDFWNMVWEQNTATIVMLTNLVELGKVKCAQYWPAPVVGTVTYGDVEVRLDSVVELRDYTLRNFTVKHVPTDDSHTVLQFHYTKWPDYGTPKLAAPLLNFLRAVHTSNPPEAGPIMVHCSAGVGRSGTVITIDYCLHQLKADHIIDVRGFVSRMREHRNYMVQTEVQYAFIHYAVLEAITYGDTSFPLSSFSLSYQHLQQKNKESGQTLLEEEYKRLGSVKTMGKRSTFVQRVKQKGPTNRSIHYPGHASYSEGASPHEYNAHYIDAYFTPKLLVMADGPEENTAAKFWQMVWDQDCAYIIMLTPLDAHYYSYWPGKGEQEAFGNILVTVEEETAEHYYTTRVITVSNTKIGISQKMTQYQFVGWTTQFLPPVPTFVSFICDVLKGVETLQKNQKALVHDMKSQGPSGIFCSLCFCIERLRVERMVDVFQAVQNMQLQRPGTIESMQQYAFIYDCVYEFIRTHSS